MICQLCRGELEEVLDADIAMFRYLSFWCTTCDSFMVEIYRYGDFLRSEWGIA